jgi:hypothetical protein
LSTTDAQIKYYEEQSQSTFEKIEQAEKELQQLKDEYSAYAQSTFGTDTGAEEAQISGQFTQKIKEKEKEIESYKTDLAYQTLQSLQQTYSNIQQQIIDLKKDLPPELQNIQGPALNPNDSIEFTKYAYLSPSIINFGNLAPSFSLISNPSNPTMPTDLKKLDNALLNIIKYNFKSGQILDFPKFTVATGVGIGDDKILSPDENNEKKYDLLTLMSLQQASVHTNASDDSGGVVSSTKAGGFIGSAIFPEGSETFDSTDIVELLETASDSDQYDPVDVFKSAINPSSALFASLSQQLFKLLSIKQWTWNYYVQNFGDTFAKEFVDWSAGNALLNLFNAEGVPYLVDNSPLKRAPNHVKALMLHLDFTKDIENPAFNILKQYLQVNKPYAFNYQLNNQQVGYIDSNSLNVGPEDYFGMPTDALKMYGTATFKQIEPKNKIIYQNPEFLSFFLLNYKNIVKIEFLTGFGSNKNNKLSINQPLWNELTFELVQTMVQRRGKILCRMIPYEKELYGVKRHEFLELPLYNEHFIIDFNDFIGTNLTSGTAPASEEQQRSTPPVEVRDGHGTRKLIDSRQPSDRDNSIPNVFADRVDRNESSSTQPEDQNQEIPTSAFSTGESDATFTTAQVANDIQFDQTQSDDREDEGSQNLVVSSGGTGGGGGYGGSS